jgi:hypothetical protein
VEEHLSSVRSQQRTPHIKVSGKKGVLPRELVRVAHTAPCSRSLYGSWGIDSTADRLGVSRLSWNQEGSLLGETEGSLVCHAPAQAPRSEFS